MLTRLYRQAEDGVERCFYIETTEALTQNELGQIVWLVAETFEPKHKPTTTAPPSPRKRPESRSPARLPE